MYVRWINFPKSNTSSGTLCAPPEQYHWRWGQISGNQVMMEPKWHFGAMIKAENPCWLHPTSVSDVYKVFEHLYMLWMGTLGYPYTVELAKLFAQILVLWGQCGYEMMAWQHCRGKQPSLTASHIHIGCIWSVWAPSYAVDGHMGAPLHSYTSACGKATEN